MSIVKMLSSSSPKQQRFILLLLLLCSLVSYSSSLSDSCSSGSLYTCPNCGGFDVEDCFDCDGYVSTDTTHNICFDRKLFQKENTDPDDHDDHYHFLWLDLAGTLVWFIMAGVATACGVGGGGIYVPLGILLFQFSPKQAAGLSQASIFGASLGGLLLNSRDRHPVNTITGDPGKADPETGRVLLSVPAPASASQQTDSDSNDDANKTTTVLHYTRPLINYDMALFLAPMEMAGAVLGVLVQKILPNWMYLLIAIVVLSYTSFRTYNKYRSVRAKELALEQSTTAAANEKMGQRESGDTLEDGASNTEQQQPIIEGSAVSVGKGVIDIDMDDSEAQGMVSIEQEESAPVIVETNNTDSPAPDKETAEATTVLRKEYLTDDMRQYPTEKIVALVVLWIGLFLLTLLKGGKGVESLVGINCDSAWYGVLIALQFVWMFGFALFFGSRLLQYQVKREAVQYPFLPDDPVWNTKSLRFYGGFTFIAGIIAGLIGVGGGMVLGPLMIIMGIHPRVSSATTATMIALTSSSIAVIYVTSGIVPWSYAVFYFLVCLVGAIVGKRKIDGYVKRTGRASLLVFILAAIIAFATVGCVVILFTRLAEKDWCLDGFKTFCDYSADEGECPADRMLESLMLGTGWSS